MRILTVLTLALTSLAAAQVTDVETFDNGNPWSWEFDDFSNGATPATGGNPGAYLEVTGIKAQTMPAIRLHTRAPGSLYEGNLRQLGVTEMGMDFRHVLGSSPFGEAWYLCLGNDGGTPGDWTDDCLALYFTGTFFQFPAPDWISVDVTVPSQETTLPAGWSIWSYNNACPDDDVAWNSILEDVSYAAWAVGHPSLVPLGEFGLDFDNMRLTYEPSASIGSNYCGPANLNSTGGSAQITAFGSESAVLNAVRLEATLLPTNEFGYFLNSQAQGFVLPPGSQGNLCLGGGIGRYAADVASTGAAGELILQLDLTDTPTPGGATAIQAGETWHFQCWFRDQNPSPTSNFTDGITITFR